MLSGKALRALREHRGLSQAALAEAAGVLQSSVSAYERGLRSPTLETMQRLLAVLENDFYDLADELARASGTPVRSTSRHEPQSVAGIPDERILEASSARLAEVMEALFEKAADRLPQDALEAALVNAMAKRLRKEDS